MRKRGNACGAGFGEWLAMGNCSKKRFFSIRDQDRAPGAGMWVFSGIAKRITLLKQRNWGGNRAAGAVSKWKAVRAAARCQKSVRKTQIGRARRHYPHGGEVTRQKLCAGKMRAGKMRGGNSASGQAGNHIVGIPAASSATYGRRQCGDGCSSPFFHYYNIIVTFLICRDFFDRAPKAP